VNASGQPEFNLNLNLSELGDMNVRIIRVENGIAVLFNSQTEKGALQLGQNLSSLQTALEQKGLVVQNIQMMVQNQVVPLQQLIPQTRFCGTATHPQGF
jgi:flagellar hook-length control protein FliK